MAEHTGRAESPDMLANSGTTETARAIAWLCWHVNRHTAHHAYPGVPFHVLPALDSALGDAVRARETGGYRAVHRQIRADAIGGTGWIVGTELSRAKVVCAIMDWRKITITLHSQAKLMIGGFRWHGNSPKSVRSRTPVVEMVILRLGRDS